MPDTVAQEHYLPQLHSKIQKYGATRKQTPIGANNSLQESVTGSLTLPNF